MKTLLGIMLVLGNLAAQSNSAAQLAIEALRNEQATSTLDSEIEKASIHVSDEPRPVLKKNVIAGWLSLRVKNNYVNRAFVLSEEPRTDALLGVVVNDKHQTIFDSYSLLLYGNASFEDDPNHIAGEEGLNEIDYSVEVAKTFDPVTVTLGWQEFFLPLHKHEAWSTLNQHKFWIQELYTFITACTVLCPTLKVYYDLGDGGVYSELGVSHTWQLNDTWNLNVGATVGATWGEYYTLPDGISDASMTLGFTYKVSDTFSLEAQGGFRVLTHPFPGDDDIYPIIWAGATYTF